MLIPANDQLKDAIESLIILSLDANIDPSEAKVVTRNRSITTEDQGKLLRLPSLKPVSAYTFDAVGGRIYACDPGLLTLMPWEILDRHAEVMMLDGDNLKWYGLERLPSLPKGVAVGGKVEVCYALHMRLIPSSKTGLNQYVRRIVPFDKNGRPLPAKIHGNWICVPEAEGKNAVLCASVIEDAHRTDSMLATVRDATQIRFPVPLDNYKKVFADRTGPLLGSGKRKAILHWVSEHLRRSTVGTQHKVVGHARGVDEFVIDGLSIGIAKNG